MAKIGRLTQGKGLRWNPRSPRGCGRRGSVGVTEVPRRNVALHLDHSRFGATFSDRLQRTSLFQAPRITQFQSSLQRFPGRLSGIGHHETPRCLDFSEHLSIFYRTSVWLNTKPALPLMYSISFRSPPRFVFLGNSLNPLLGSFHALVSRSLSAGFRPSFLPSPSIPSYVDNRFIGRTKCTQAGNRCIWRRIRSSRR